MMAKGPRKKQKEGARQELLLDKPRLRLPHSSLYFEVTFYTLLVLLGGFGALCCVGTAFHLPVYAGPLVAVGCVCGLLGVAQSLLPRGRLVLLARRSPDGVERWYSQGFYPVWARALITVTSPLPFSLAEVLVIGAALLAVWWLVSFARALWKGDRPRLEGAPGPSGRFKRGVQRI